MRSLFGIERRGLRTDKDAKFWATRGKRISLILKDKQQQPNGLFGAMLRKRVFKPNGLFSLKTKRSLKPSGIFLLTGKSSFNPSSIVDALEKRDVEDLLANQDSDETGQNENDKEFWAIRGKKDDEKVIKDLWTS